MHSLVTVVRKTDNREGRDSLIKTIPTHRPILSTSFDCTCEVLVKFELSL